MGQASINIDINAKVKGWQEELAKMKAAAAKIDLGSDFGKKLSAGIDSLEKQINSVGKNLTQRLTSDSSIDSFTTKLNNIDSQFVSLGQHLSEISLDNLLPEYAAEQVKELNEELTNTRTLLDSSMGAGFTEAIEQSKDLKVALQRLVGEDYTKIGIQDAVEVLTTGIANMATQIEEADKKLVNLREELRRTQEQSKQLNSEPILSVDNMRAQVESMVGQQGDYGFKSINTEKLSAYVEELRARLSAAGADLTSETSKINQIITQIGNSETTQQLAMNLDALKRELSSEKVEISAGDLGLSNVQTRVNQLISDNASALEAAKANLTEKLRELKIPDDVIAQLVPDFVKAVKSGNWEQGISQLESQLNQYKSTIQEKAEEIKVAENQLIDAINSTKSVRGKAVFTQETAQRALEQDYPKIIEDLKNKNADLENRVKALESQIKEKLNATTGSLKDTGTAISQQSQQQLIDNTNAAIQYKSALEQVQAREQMIGKIQGVVQRWFSIYAAVRMVSNAVKDVIATIKELDATITEIAIVTKMDQGDLWGQMESYTSLAREYAASISGVYKVSQLYYQQGLQQNDVMALTEQTLKMARISGLDYSQATDYMTNAVRSFKMEMTEAQRVVDVYSAVAASSATNVTELASAMSKTASSAQAVGSSFENTTAMMAVMIEATRESAENIGSALKSIISRYGELKTNPNTLIDGEGEALSLNKVDTALQSVGISLHDAQGQFREFDDVIMELAASWDSIDKNTQRYIATVMAGNRQQSRFLALVSSYDRLKELTAEAADSEDAAQLQFLKTLDSVDAKVQQFQTSIQALYVDSGLENVYKGLLDWINQIATSLDQLSTKGGLATAVGKIGATFTTLALLVKNVFNSIKTHFTTVKEQMAVESKVAAAKEVQTAAEAEAKEAGVYEAGAVAYLDAAQQKKLAAAEAAEAGVKAAETEAAAWQKTQEAMKKKNALSKVGMVASAAGLALTTAAASIDVDKQRGLKAGLTGAGSVLSGIGTGMMIGGWAGAAVGALSALPGIIEAIGMATESTEEKVSRLGKAIEEASNKKIESKDNLKTLTEYKKKYEELRLTQNVSAEKKQEFIDLQNEIAASYPELISRMDEEGNYVINMAEGYEKLAEAKRNAYKEDFVQYAAAELNGLNDLDYVLKNIYGHKNVENGKRGIFGTDSDRVADLMQLDYSSGIPTTNITNIFNSGMGVSTANAVFNNKLPSWTWDMVGEGRPSPEWEEDGLDEIVSMYEYFVKSAQSGKDLITAQTELINHYKKNNTWTQEQEDFINGFDSKIYNELQLRSEVPKDLKTLVHNRMGAYATEYINLIADAADVTFDTESTNIQKRYAKEAFLTNWDQFYENNKDRIGEYDDEGNQIDWGTLVQEYYQSHEEFWFDAQKDSDVLKNLNTEAEKFYSELGTHTKDDIQDLFPDWETNDISKARKEFFEKIFESDYGKIIERYKTWTTESQEYGVEDYSDKFGPQFLESIQDQYTAILDNSSLSDNVKKAQVAALNKINSIISSDAFTFNQKNTLLTQMSSADFTSVKGIYDFIESLEGIQGLDIDNTGLRDAIVGFKDTLSVNIESELQSYIDDYAQLTTNLEKDMSNASKGMNFKDAMDLAGKLGKSINDFRFTAGKYYYDDVDDIISYYQQQNEEYLDALEQEIENKQTILQDQFTIKRDISTNKPDMDWKIWADLHSILEDESATSEDWEKAIAPYEEFLLNNGINLRDLFSYRSFQDHYIAGQWDDRVLSDRIEKKWNEIKSQFENIPESISTQFSEPLDEIFAQAGDNLDEITSVIETMDWDNIEGINKNELLNLANSYINRSDTDLELSFSEWLENYYNQMYEATAGASKAYTKDLTARNYLNSGNIDQFINTIFSPSQQQKTADDFLAEAELQPAEGISTREIAQIMADEYNATIQSISDEERALLISAITSGNLDGLTDEQREQLAEYEGLIYDTYANVSKTVYNSMITAVKGGESKIKITDTNKGLLQRLAKDGLVTFGAEDYVKDETGKITDELLTGALGKFDVKAIADLSEEQWANYVNAEIENREERIKLLQEFHDIKYPDRTKTFNELSKKKSITVSEFQNFLKSAGKEDYEDYNKYLDDYGLVLNTISGDLDFTDYDKWFADQEAYLNSIEDKSSEAYRIAKAQFDSMKRTQAYQKTTDISSTIKNIASNYKAVDEAQYEKLQELLTADEWNQVAKYFKDNKDGTWTADLTGLKAAIDANDIQLSQAAQDGIIEAINTIYDNALSAITTARTLTITGTTNTTDMQKFVDSYNEKFKTNKSISDLFSYSADTQAFTLNHETLAAYVKAQADELVAIGTLKPEDVQAYIKDTAAKNVDISSYISSDKNGKALETLSTQLGAYYAETLSLESIDPEDYLPDDGAVNQGILNQAKRAAQDAAKRNEELIKSYTEASIANLNAGGQTAVNELLKFDPNATKDQIEAAYRAQVAPLVSLMGKLSDLQVGTFVEANEIDALNKAGFTVQQNGLITAVGDLTTAYKSIYESMIATGEATAADLNSAAAKLLDSQYAGARATRDTLTKGTLSFEDLTNMYQANGQVFGAYTSQRYNGSMLEEYTAYDPQKALDELIEQDIISINEFGEIRIKKFEEYAKKMGWESESEEYKRAYSDWVDSQISEDEKNDPIKRQTAQLQKLASGATNTKLNITELVQDDNLKAILEEEFAKRGEVLGDWITFASEAERDNFIMALNAEDYSEKPELQQMVESLQAAIDEKRNQYSGLKGIIAKRVSRSTASTYAASIGENTDEASVKALMTDLGYVWDELSKEFVADSNTLTKLREKVAEWKNDTSTDHSAQIAEAEAAIADLEYEFDMGEKNNAVLTALQNYQALSNTGLETLKAAFASYGDKIDWNAIVTSYQDGTSSIDVGELRAQLEKIGYKFNDAAKLEIAKITDAYLSNISNATTLSLTGTTSQEEMANFKKSYETLTKKTLSASAFSYSDLSEAFLLDPTIAQEMREAQIKELVDNNLITQETAAKYLAQEQKKILENVNIESFLSSTNRDASSKARQTLEQSMRTALGYTVESEDWIDYLSDKAKTEYSAGIKIGKYAEQQAKDAAERAKKRNEIHQQVIDDEINALEAGGDAAIEIWKKYATEDLTADQIKTAYRTKVDNLSSAMSQILTLQVNDVIDPVTAELLKGSVSVDSNGVVTSIINMTAAYKNLYQQMKATANATESEINAAFADLISANQASETDAIAALGDAMGMSYASLGEYLTKYTNTYLDEVVDEFGNILDASFGLESIGNGKVRIYDFAAFAEKMKWQPDSEEYTAAFKAYNDSLIALDRKTEKSIYDELSKIASSTGGERVNLTDTWRVLTKNLDADAMQELQAKLYQAGAILNEGILQISENADIAGIVDAIASQESIASSLIPSELAELRDALDSLLTNITNSIKNGISGTLSNKDATALQQFAGKRGINLDFTKTANGLKLSTKSAMQLYLTMKDIDRTQAQQILPEISKMSDKYSTLQNACKRYNDLIKQNTESLREEKVVLEDLMKSMMTDPDQYKFMSGSELPAGWQMVENALTAQKDAYDKIKAAKTSKFMETSDFYNIIQAAAAYNPDFQLKGLSTDEIIAQAGNAFTIKDGKIGIDLSKTGLNLSEKDLTSLYAQLESGLQLMANQATAYYDMNDKFAQISEAVSRIPPIDFSHVIGADGGFAEGGSEQLREYIDNLQKNMPGLVDALGDLQIGTTKFADILKASGSQEDWSKLWEGSSISPENMAKFIQGIGEIDWSDATQAAAHVSELVKQTGETFNLEIDPNSFIHFSASGEPLKIDLNNKTFKNKVLAEFNKSAKDLGVDKTTAKDLTQQLQALADKYETTTDVQEKIKIRRMLAIAEGKFDPTNFKYDKTSGTLSYTYNGQTYTVKVQDTKKGATDTDKANLGNRIAAAISLEDQGYTITTVENTLIKAEKILRGGVLVEVTFDETTGTTTYTGSKNGISVDADSYDELLQKMIQKGIADDSQNHKKVELEGGFEGTVMIDSHTGFVYTMYLDEEGKPHYIYEGMTFDSYSDFRQYLNMREKFGGDVNRDEDTNTNTINITDSIQIVVKKVAGQIITEYYVAGMKVEGNNMAAVIEAWEAARGQTGATIDDTTLQSDSSRAITFTQNGVPIRLTVNADGSLLYSFTSDFGTFTATSKAGFENALAGLATLTGGELGGEGDATYTITTSAGLIVTVNGSDVTVVNSNNETVELPEELKALQAPAKVTVEADGSDAESTLQSLLDEIKGISDPTWSVKVTTTAALALITITALKKVLDSLRGATISVTVTPASAAGTFSKKGLTKKPVGKKLSGKLPGIDPIHAVKVMGNVALAGGTPTLMGELGPELVVSHGRYFVVGQGGAEMVSLADDAVVFNHIQTAQLLTNGKTSRGRPHKSERESVGMVAGNIGGGPARLNYTGYEIKDSGSAVSAEAEVLLTKLTSSQKSKLSSLISDLITKGFENIDWDDIEKELGAKLTAELKEDAKGSMREFVRKYAEYCDKTITEINELYFEAWQADLGTAAQEVTDAIKSLSFFAGGGVGGSAADWSTILGKYGVKVSDLVQENIMEWNADLGQYIITDTEKLWEKFHIDLTGQHQNVDLIARLVNDQLREAISEIDGYIESALAGTLSDEDKNKLLVALQKQLGMSEDEISEFWDTIGNSGNLLDPAAVEKIKEKIRNNDKLTQEEKDAWLASLEQLVADQASLLQQTLMKTQTGMSATEKQELITKLQKMGIDLSSDDFWTKVGDQWTLDVEKYKEALEELRSRGSLTDEQVSDAIAEVEDSLRETFKTMGDLIKEGLSGTLTSVDMNKLKSYLKLNGLEDATEGLFVETVNGWSISLEKAAETLKQIASSTKLTDNQKAQLSASINDAITDAVNSITDIIANALKGSMSHTDLNTLNSFLTANGMSTISLDSLTQMSTGLKMSSEQAALLYQQLKSINVLAAQMAFTSISDALKESNDEYKTMSSLLAHIADLNQKIQDTTKYSDERIRQYQAELALAEEIAEVRATSEDSSFSFIDEALPGALNNPLNYLSSWQTGIQALMDAAESGVVDFKTLYNIAKEINEQAAALHTTIDFMGHSFDGTAESLGAFTQQMASSLTSVDGQIGVALSSFGDDMTTGADTALHSMAQAQITIIKGLIAVLDTIIALEKLTDLDIDKNGIFNFDDLGTWVLGEDGKKHLQEFSAEFEKRRKEIIAAITEGSETYNKELAEAMEKIKINGKKLSDIIKQDAADWTESDAEVLNALLQAVQSGDYDLNNISASMREILMKKLNNGVLEIGDMKLVIKYGILVEQDKDGNYLDSKGNKYKTPEDAARATILHNLGAIDVKVDAEGGTATGTLRIGKQTITVTTTGDKTEYIGPDGKKYPSINALLRAQWTAYAKEHGLDENNNLLFEEWKLTQGYKVAPKLSDDIDTSAFSRDQITALVGKTFEDLQREWEECAGDPDKELQFKAKYGIDFTDATEEDFEKLKELLGIETKRMDIIASVTTADEATQKFVEAINSGSVSVTLGVTTTGALPTDEGSSITVDTTAATEAINALQELINQLKTTVEDIGKIDIGTTAKAASRNINDFKSILEETEEIINKIDDITLKAEVVNLDKITTLADALADVAAKVDSLKDSSNSGVVEIKITTEAEGGSEAKGNVALAAGKTLMGELGPELVVSHGRYYTVGNNGAEMVDLPKDAIVFNHLQTQQLLNGGRSSRGTAVTTEQNAVSMATGNAMATASEARATLQTLLAMWESILDMSVQDLVKTTTDTSGGTTKVKDTAAWLAQVERWYNLLQKIARTEKQINQEEALRNKISSDMVPNGEEYFRSQQRTLGYLKEQAEAYKELAISKEDYFEKRREALNSEESPFSQFYTYDEYGQIKFKDDGFRKLEEIVHQNDQGQTLTPKEQYDLLVGKYGLGAYGKYKSDGTEIKQEDYTDDSGTLSDDYYRDITQAIWDRMDAERQEMQALYDDKEDAKLKYLEAIEDANSILKEIRQNQIEVEDKLIEAIEKREQDVIDTLTDEREKLSEASSKYINGLTDALSREKAMYTNNTEASDLALLRRQLSILQRTGGSASQIASVQASIADKEKTAYFDAQQNAIDAVQDASDLELEKLQEQIDLMTEQLEYSKEHGLWWAEVATILQGSKEDIISFINAYSEDYIAASTLSQSETTRELLSQVGQFKEYQRTNSEMIAHAMTDGFESVLEPYKHNSEAIQVEINNLKTPIVETNNAVQEIAEAVNKEQENNGSNGIVGNRGTNASGSILGSINGKSMYRLNSAGEPALTRDYYTNTYGAKGGAYYDDQQAAAKAWAQLTREERMQRVGYDWDAIYGTPSYASGGDVTFTGLAMLHGSNINPETVLNAPATKTWKQEITGKQNTSLMSRLAELGQILAGIENVDKSITTTSDEGINIEHVEVNMNVKEIASDYDARRAGETAMDEIIKIARKTGYNSVRR